MYPLAQILHGQGYYLTGSDNNETETLEAVRKMGIPVFLGQRAENIGDSDLIVYSAAIMADNPELIAAKASGARVMERSELLGIVTGWYDNCICVSGTHGKTTTSALLTEIFIRADEDISCVIGGKLASVGGSGRCGSSDVMVCEACEYVNTFLRLHPDIGIILNVDADHLEFFKNIENIKASFEKFANNASKLLIINGDDANTLEAVKNVDKKKVTFGFGKQNDFSAEIISHQGINTRFRLFLNGKPDRELTIHVPGKHNVLNALAAIAAAVSCGLTLDRIQPGLDSFHGAIRRFEKITESSGITVVDDYAHHPAEIAATLTAAKDLGFSRVWAVFQPFTYSRTKILLDDFVTALSLADKVVLTDIMGSREKNDIGIYTQDLGKKINGAVWFDYDKAQVDSQSAAQKQRNFSDVVDYLCKNCKKGDLVITMGCGDVYKVAKAFAKRI